LKFESTPDGEVHIYLFVIMVHYLTVLVIVVMKMVLPRKSLCRLIIWIFMMTVLLLTR
ncbi:hypothetical protein T4A_3086, partial [Trichinella pseudospiralis]